jgi:hypothetical protein
VKSRSTIVALLITALCGCSSATSAEDVGSGGQFSLGAAGGGAVAGVSDLGDPTGGAGGTTGLAGGAGGTPDLAGGAGGSSAGGSDVAAGSAAGMATGSAGATSTTAFQLRAEFAGPCTRATPVDVNLGNSPEAFVRAAYCQVNGSEPAADVVSMWSGQLRTLKYVRRIDVVHQFCANANRTCTLSYSDPWLTEPENTTPCTRSGTREMGAVQMFFSDCPGGVNCGMDWANTHAYGMDQKSPLLGFDAVQTGYYVPSNPGFWRRELVDAAYAGLQFLMPNAYGPDITDDNLNALNEALAETKNAVKIGLFDDSWGWGNLGGAFQTPPNFNDPNGAADTIYSLKWKPFFSKLSRDGWYAFNGRPLIYVYNAGTLKPANRAAAVIAGLRARFQADFGVSPFIVVDQAFFADPNMINQADSRFVWNTFSCGAGSTGSCVPGKLMSESTMNGVKLDQFMVKWDSLGRDDPGHIATQNDQLFKDESLLKQRLIDSASAQLAVVATWNDLGEGTGIERNYDYYANGAWLEPDAFIMDIRASQCSN